jgi:ABC-type transporter Mla maintaining outer membrane lipid asymmetry ATPase subunit MlaF
VTAFPNSPPSPPKDSVRKDSVPNHSTSKASTSNDSTPVVELRGIVKNYGGLRPLRVASLDVRAGERVSLEGFDRITAEVFVNLLNGAVLPDEGDVRVLGQSTRDIDNSEAWLESLDRFGLVTERAVLLGGSPIAHNLALPFSLEIDPMPDDLRARVVALAREVEMDEAQLEALTGNAGPAMQMRVHLARALATDPAVLLLEHPTVSLPREAVAAFGGLVRRVAERRQLAVIALTGDKEFADEMAEAAFALQPGTGKLTSTRGWRRWLNVGR